MVGKQKRKKANSKQLLELIESQQYRCALSGIELTPDSAALDHIEPLSNGGTDEVENLQWLHEEVNRMKGTKNNKQFLALVKKVARWTG